MIQLDALPSIVTIDDYELELSASSHIGSVINDIIE